MVRMLFVCVVLAGAMIGAAPEAAATPSTLPGLDISVELPAGVTIERDDGDCVLWASMTAIRYGEAGSGTFASVGYWVPTSWYPAWGVADVQGARELRMCRVLDAGLTAVVALVATVPPGTELGEHVSGAVKTLEAELQRVGVPRFDYSSNDVDRLIRTLNASADDVRRIKASRADARVATVEPATSAEPTTEPRYTPEYVSTRRVAEPEDDDEPRKPAGYAGLRIAVDMAALTLEGDGAGTRIGGSIALPFRYRRSGVKAGWVYGGRLAAGRAGDVLVGSGHGAIGLAVGQPHSQGALAMVVGGDRAPAGSPLTAQDGGFAGLQVLLRFPLARLTVLEATATLIAGSHGRASWLELSLVTVRFSSLSVLLGVERRRWDDGMTSFGGQLGVGF